MTHSPRDIRERPITASVILRDTSRARMAAVWRDSKRNERNPASIRDHRTRLDRYRDRSFPGISGAGVNLPGDFSVSRNRVARLPAGQCAERERRRLQMRGLPAPQVPTGSTAGAGQVFWDPG